MKYTSIRIEAELFYMDKNEVISKEILSLLSDLDIKTNTIVKVECFLPITNEEEHLTCSNSLNSVLSTVFKDKIPASLLIDQTLIDNTNKALIKFSICDDKSTTIEFKEFQKHHYCIINNNEEKILMSGGIKFGQADETLRIVQLTYDFMEQLLDHEEMHFGHVALQSNFINDISGLKTDPTTGWNNLQIVDEIRSLYFDPNLFKHGYPLQLTHNISNKAFVIDFIAASKDGFPTAQFNTDIEAEQTISCYLPGLKKVFMRPIVDSKVSSDEQLANALALIKKIIATNESISDVLDEVKVKIADDSIQESIEQSVTNQVNTNKFIFYHSPLKEAGLKIDIEAIASL